MTVKLTNCTATQAGATTVKWYSDGAEGGAYAMKTLTRTSLGNNTYSYKGSVVDRPTDLVNIMAGIYPTSIRTVRGTVKMQRTAPSLRLLRRSTMAQHVYLAKGYGSAFNKGDHLEIYANHKRANWDTMRYGSYSNGTVTLQFRTATGSYQTLQTGKADSPFFTNVTVDGCYRFVFLGNLTTGPAKSRGTCIDVR